MSHTHSRPAHIVLRPVPAAPAVGFPLPKAAPPADAGITPSRWLDQWMMKEIKPCRAEATITFRGLRHTFASIANDARVPMYQISRAMGHSSPSITQRIYTHLFDQTHGEVLAAVAKTIV